jgi:hypothetical protein
VSLRRLLLPMLLAVFLPCCSLAPTRRVTIEVPAVSPIGIQNYGEIVVADFKEGAPVPDLALGRDIADYLAREMKTAFRGRVSRRSLPEHSQPATQIGAAAGSAGREPGGILLLSGEARLLQESQKALSDAGLPEDGPFKFEGRGLVERKRFTLEIALRLVDAARGETILERTFTETRTYDNAQTHPGFALFDLLPVIKGKLFPQLFGRQALEQRTLLLRPPRTLPRPFDPPENVLPRAFCGALVDSPPGPNKPSASPFADTEDGRPLSQKKA